ncbi:cysteine desulfurase-like protein [Bacteroidota bacterium]
MNTQTPSELKMDIDFVRNQFPALKNNFVYMDNAGGTQALESVVNKISNYMVNYNAQLGASYEVSAAAGEKLDYAVKELAGFINAGKQQEVVVGPSSSMLLRILSICLSKQWQSGDEVIVTNSDHEANVSCWTDLQEKGIVIKIWKINPETLEFDINDLRNLISDKTRLVAMVHVSNILGTINPIRDVARVVHEAGALFCVDGVAYAPHRLIDVREFEVDFYVFSSYKVYGPHLGVMYGKYDLLREMDGINHYFITKDEVPYKFQPGNLNYELTYSLLGITEYFKNFYDYHFPDEKGLDNWVKFRKSFELIAEHEQLLAKTLLDYLKTKDDIRIIGQKDEDSTKRVSTISFIHNRLKSSEVVEKVDRFRVGIRYGDFYAKKIIIDLGLVEKDGVIRVSMVHYNTIDELSTLIKAFEYIFKE